jgi:phospholipid/cholesterol/gamma-HCH transport system permease protein
VNPAAPVWRELGGYTALGAHAFRHLRVLRIAPVRLVFLRQVYYTGIEALGTISLIALLTGALVITQAISLMGANPDLVLRVLVWVVVRELGPLFAAILIIARSSPAIAAELALMKTHREIAHLREMGIPANDYLVVPRIAGVTLSVMALTFYFQVIAILGGMAAAALYRHDSFVELLGNFIEVVSLAELAGTVVKSFVFGLVIATIACFHGLAVDEAITDVPKAAIKAVLRSLMAVFAIDAVIAYASFAL